MSHAFYTVYDADTGRILRTGFCQADDVAIQSSSNEEIVLEGEFSSEIYYVIEHEAVPRPLMFTQTDVEIRADGEERLILPVQPGTVIKDYGVPFILDTTFEFASAKPGEWFFEFEPPFPYRPQSLRIIAND